MTGLYFRYEGVLGTLRWVQLLPGNDTPEIQHLPSSHSACACCNKHKKFLAYPDWITEPLSTGAGFPLWNGADLQYAGGLGSPSLQYLTCVIHADLFSLKLIPQLTPSWLLASPIVVLVTSRDRTQTRGQLPDCRAEHPRMHLLSKCVFYPTELLHNTCCMERLKNLDTAHACCHAVPCD